MSLGENTRLQPFVGDFGIIYIIRDPYDGDAFKVTESLNSFNRVASYADL